MQLLNIFHVLVAIALVGIVLIQKGQGATVGASFGAGASATVFGARGAGNFLTRATWVLAALFCTISLTMAVVVSRTVGAPADTDLGVVADSAVQEEAGDDGAADAADDVPSGTELSVKADEESASDVSPLDPESGEKASDLPEFEAPEGAGAIKGSEVRDEVRPESGQADESADEGDADSGR